MTSLKEMNKFTATIVITTLAVAAGCSPATPTYTQEDYDRCNKVTTEAFVKDSQSMGEMDRQGRVVMALTYKELVDDDIRMMGRCSSLRPRGAGGG
jgi:hypothetical protein